MLKWALVDPVSVEHALLEDSMKRTTWKEKTDIPTFLLQAQDGSLARLTATRQAPQGLTRR
jgi:hypothetical protein